MIIAKQHKRSALVIVLFSVFVISIAIFLVNRNNSSSAADARHYNAGNIMSDFVMTNKNSMTEAQIQAFLNSKNSCNDTNIAKAAQYPQYNYNIKNGKFVCMAQESFNGESAARIIWQAAQDYGINPQVLIVLLQKEQSLITDTWPNNIQYRSATGYGCPDTADCDGKYYGFKNQVRNAANFFRAYQTGNTSWYKLVWPGDKYTGTWQPFHYDVRLHPNAGCGTIRTFIENRATASLYSYTPYRPNQAALNAQNGTGDGCSSYGNRNFWLYFSDWFGNTQTLAIQPTVEERYVALGGLGSYLGRPTTLGDCGIPGQGCYQNFQFGHIYWSPASGAWDVSGGVGDRWVRLGAERSYLLYPTAAEVRGLKNGGAYQQFQTGRIYWSAATGAWDVSGAISERWIGLGAEKSLFGYPKGAETRGLKNSGSYQQFQIGRIYWSAATGAHPVAGGIGDYWLNRGAQNSTLGYPTSEEKVDSSGRVYQEFEGGKIYWTAARGAWGILTNIEERYGALNGINGYLGAPYTLGGCGIRSGGCYQNFLGGNIYWSPVSGTWDVSGGIGAKWIALGAERSTIGYPTAAETHGLKNNGAYQSYENGRIYWSPATNAIDISGDILAKWLAIGGERSLFGYPTSAEMRGLKNSGSYQQFQIGRIYWSAATGAHPVAGGIGDYWRQKGAEKSTLGYPISGEQVDGQGRVYQQFENGIVYWTATQGAWS